MTTCTQHGGQSRLKISVDNGPQLLEFLGGGGGFAPCIGRGQTQVQARGDSSDSSDLVMMRRGEVEAIPEEATMVDSLFPDLHRYALLLIQNSLIFEALLISLIFSLFLSPRVLPLPLSAPISKTVAVHKPKQTNIKL